MEGVGGGIHDGVDHAERALSGVNKAEKSTFNSGGAVQIRVSEADFRENRGKAIFEPSASPRRLPDRQKGDAYAANAK